MKALAKSLITTIIVPLHGTNPVSISQNSPQIETLSLFMFTAGNTSDHRPFVSLLWIKLRGLSAGLLHHGHRGCMRLAEEPWGRGWGLLGTRSWAAVGGLPYTHISLIRSQSERRLGAVLWRWGCEGQVTKNWGHGGVGGRLLCPRSAPPQTVRWPGRLRALPPPKRSEVTDSNPLWWLDLNAEPPTQSALLPFSCKAVVLSLK